MKAYYGSNFLTTWTDLDKQRRRYNLVTHNILLIFAPPVVGGV